MRTFGHDLQATREAEDLASAIQAALMLTGTRRDEVARILEIVAKDGLPGPRDLDVALDAIEQAFLHTSNSSD